MTVIYLVCLVDINGEVTPLVAFLSEEAAKMVADRMGDLGTVYTVPLVDEER